MGEYATREYRIDDEDVGPGLEDGFGDAVDKALEAHPDGTEVQIEEIWVKKRGDRSFHDYRIVLSNP